MKEFMFGMKTDIRFAPGLVSSVGEIAKEYGGKHVLLVADKGIRQTGLADKVRTFLEAEGIQVTDFDQIVPNPRISDCEEGARMGLEKGVNKRQLYTNGLLSIFAGFLLLCALAPVLNFVPFVRDTVQGHWVWLLLFVLVSCLRTLNCQFVRAREMVRLYAVDGILCTLTNLLFNILFLSGFHLGATGIILAMISSDSCSAIFLFFVSRIWKYLKPPRVNFRLWKQMLTYSVPLISASMFWWVTSTSDKIFISAMIGTDANGLFAASYKLPTILTIVATLFTEAWQISAFTDGTKKGRAAFFSRVFGV